jgi:GT2 family glycosyltransferase
VIAGRARLVTVSERGAGPTRNGAVAASAGEVLAFTDADCVPEPDWLRAVVLALRDADVVGGRVQVLVDREAQNPVESFERVFAFDNESYVTRKGFTVTANLACRRQVFDEVGGFRVGVSEDLEWSRRATSNGFRLAYAKAAVVGHPARASWQELIAKWRRINVETYGLSAGRRGRLLRWLARASLLPASAIAHSPRVLARADLTMRQKFGALGVLYRIRLWRLFDAVRVAAQSGAR